VEVEKMSSLRKLQIAVAITATALIGGSIGAVVTMGGSHTAGPVQIVQKTAATTPTTAAAPVPAPQATPSTTIAPVAAQGAVSQASPAPASTPSTTVVGGVTFAQGANGAPPVCVADCGTAPAATVTVPNVMAEVSLAAVAAVDSASLDATDDLTDAEASCPTGTITVSGEFPNPGSSWAPGHPVELILACS
jgi:ferredoxin